MARCLWSDTLRTWKKYRLIAHLGGATFNQRANCDFERTNCDFGNCNYDFERTNCDFGNIHYVIGRKDERSGPFF